MEPSRPHSGSWWIPMEDSERYLDKPHSGVMRVSMEGSKRYLNKISTRQYLPSHSSSQSKETVSYQNESSWVPRLTSTEHMNHYRLFRVLHEVAIPVMREILVAGTKDKKSGETLTEYLNRHRGKSLANYRKMFGKAEKWVIESDPSFASFDVILLYKSIQLACDGISPTHDEAWHTEGTFEYHLKKLKDFRNDLLHRVRFFSTEEFSTKLEEVRVHLLTVLRLGSLRYNISLTEEKVTNKINNIIDNLFSLLNDGRKDLVTSLTEMLYLCPASAISGHNIQLKVSDIFMALEIVKVGRNEGYETIHYTDILRYALEKKEKDESISRKVILLEGVAGSGKTTLLKFLMSDWMSGQNSVSEIGNYKFIIPIHCRFTGFSCFKDLMSSLMPSARKAFQNPKQMLKRFLELPFIILLDGIDEMNNSSEKLFRDILNLTKRRNCIIVGTTRPHNVEDLYLRFLRDVNTVHLKLKGVPESCAEDFLKKYHEALRDLEVSREDTEELLNYFRTKGASLNHLWKLPLNLALLALLWSVAPDKVSLITTAYELLREIKNLAEKKLIERLSNHYMAKYLPLSILQERVKAFMASLQKEALSELCSDAIMLQEASVNNLKRCCKELGLPEEEVMEAFLSVGKVWSPLEGKKLMLSFPLKSWQEFYSSLHIYNEVIGMKRSVDFKNLDKDFMNTLCKYKVPPSFRQKYAKAHRLLQHEYISNSEPVKIHDILLEAHGKNEKSLKLNTFQNVLMMLTGVLHQSEEKVDDSLITEVVELLTRAGVKDRCQWIQILHSVKCDERVARLIAQLPGIIEGNTRISEQDTLAYATLLREKRPDSVAIEIAGKTSKVPFLREFLEVVIENRYNVDCLSLSYWYGNTNIHDISSLLDVINQLMERCRVMEYKGPLIPEMKLAESIKWLEVRVDNQASFENLHTLLSQKLNKLESLSVCLPANLDPQNLKPLPGTRARGNACEPAYQLSVDLLLLDIQSKEDFKNAADIARKLQPDFGNKMFQRICFPRMELESREVQMNASCFEGVRTCTVEFPSSIGFASEQDRDRFEDIITEALDWRNVSWRSKMHSEEKR